MENGSIGVAIKRGSPGYQYALTENSDPATTVSGGTFYVDNLYMEGLKAGNYTLTLQEIGGTNLTSGTSSTGTSLTSTSFSSTSSFAFTAADDSFYDIGYTKATTNTSAAPILFGARVENYMLYALVNGALSPSTPIATLKQYDVVEVERTSKTMTYKVNGEQVYTTSFSTNSSSLYFGVNQYGEGKILNIIADKSCGTTSWRVFGNGVTSEISNGDKITKDVILTLNCSPVEPPVIQPQLAPSNVTTYYKQSSGMREETVMVSLDESSAASLVIFNMNGILVYTDEHKDAQTDHIFDIKTLPAGTYIFKILTRSKEYTGRLLIQ